jgi:hypothetical protein
MIKRETLIPENNEVHLSIPGYSIIMDILVSGECRHPNGDATEYTDFCLEKDQYEHNPWTGSIRCFIEADLSEVNVTYFISKELVLDLGEYLHSLDGN